MNILDAAKVHELFTSCLFDDKEVDSIDEMLKSGKMILAEGIVEKIGFKTEKLELTKEEVKSMLNELDDSFHTHGGGGMSFLNACNDKHGNQWTGLHKIMEELFLLGMGLKMVKFVPRFMWQTLPGGMPYVMINTNGFE